MSDRFHLGVLSWARNPALRGRGWKDSCKLEANLGYRMSSYLSPQRNQNKGFCLKELLKIFTLFASKREFLNTEQTNSLEILVFGTNKGEKNPKSGAGSEDLQLQAFTMFVLPDRPRTHRSAAGIKGVCHPAYTSKDSREWPRNPRGREAPPTVDCVCLLSASRQNKEESVAPHSPLSGT